MNIASVHEILTTAQNAIDPLFTAAAIARALGCSKQNVFQRLTDVPADEVLFNGAKAWRIGSLPAALSRQLSEEAETKRYRTIADLLQAPFDRYEPALPWIEVAPAARDRALNLQRALLPILPLRKDAKISRTELATRGIAAYKAVHGYAINPRTWLALFDRTVERDNGAEEWQRPELYLQDNPPRISSRLPISTAREFRLEALESAFGAIPAGTTRLDVRQKTHLWTKACDELQFQIGSSGHLKKIKGVILKVFLASGWFGTDKETIRRNFNRQWEAYRKNGRCFDRRTLRRKHPIAERDLHAIVGHSLARGGDLTAGWNAARDSGDLSEELDNRCASNALRPPNRVQRVAGPLVKSLLPLTKGERAFREDGPSHIGDYSKLYAGEIFEMDDWTPEHFFYIEHEDGRPGFRFLQGQLIVVIDKASRRVLEISFTEGAYSARMIRVTLNNACRNYCLCDLLNIESGLWKRAHVIVGRKTIGFDEWEMGVREFMAVRNCRRPQGKADVEKFFDSLGHAMRPIPGWCGKDMRHTMPELLKHQISRVEKGEIHPSEFCLHKEQMIEALLRACAEYNETPQHYGRLKGLSPNQAWHAKQSPTGRPSLGSKAAYLLAYHRERVVIRKSMIVKTEGGSKHVYHSPDVSRFDRQSVLLWWNPDDLSQVAFSSLDRKEGPFIVPVQEQTPVGAQPDYAAIRRAQTSIDTTLEVRRALFRSVQPWLAKARLRPTTADASTVQFGEKLETGITAAKRERQEKNRSVRRAQRLVREVGLNGPVDTQNADDMATAVELIKEVYREETNI